MFFIYILFGLLHVFFFVFENEFLFFLFSTFKNKIFLHKKKYFFLFTLLFFFLLSSR